MKISVRRFIITANAITYCETETILSIYKMLHEHLAVKKICSRWITHNLTKAQKHARVDWCKQMLKKC